MFGVHYARECSTAMKRVDIVKREQFCNLAFQIKSDKQIETD